MEVEFAPGAMLKLKTLHLDFHVRHTMDQSGDFDFHLENLSSLEHVIVHMNCYYAGLREVEDAAASIQKALNLSPNKPKLELEKVIQSLKQHTDYHMFSCPFLVDHLFCLLCTWCSLLKHGDSWRSG
jgi:hypothetical protein